MIGSCFTGHWGNIPLRSHYEGGEDDERVTAVLFYAAGLARHHIEPLLLFDRIDRLHDHKGWLYIHLWKPIGDDAEYAIRRAWKEIGIETEENVSFHLRGDPDWLDAWNRRRFGKTTVEKCFFTTKTHIHVHPPG